MIAHIRLLIDQSKENIKVIRNFGTVQLLKPHEIYLAGLPRPLGLFSLNHLDCGFEIGLRCFLEHPWREILEGIHIF
jgi:hypothetical protein